MECLFGFSGCGDRTSGKGPLPKAGIQANAFQPTRPVQTWREGYNCPVLPPLLSPSPNGAILTLDSVGDYLVCACALPVGNPSYRSRRSQALLGHECLSPLSDNRIPSASVLSTTEKCTKNTDRKVYHFLNPKRPSSRRRGPSHRNKGCGKPAFHHLLAS